MKEFCDMYVRIIYHHHKYSAFYKSSILNCEQDIYKEWFLKNTM